MHQDTVRLFQGQMQQHTKYTGNFFYAKENSKPVLASYFFKTKVDYNTLIEDQKNFKYSSDLCLKEEIKTDNICSICMVKVELKWNEHN